MKRKIFSWMILIAMTAALSACKGAELHATVTLTEQWWSGWKKEQPEPTVITFADVAEGTVLYDSAYDGTITVSGVTEEAVVLQIEHSCFVEPNENGNINLGAAPVKTLTVKRGEEKELVTQTLDGGVTLRIAYAVGE